MNEELIALMAENLALKLDNLRLKSDAIRIRFLESIQKEPCKYCKSDVILITKVSCEQCTQSQNGAMCGKLKQCPEYGSGYYQSEQDVKISFCPVCGRKKEDEGN